MRGSPLIAILIVGVTPMFLIAFLVILSTLQPIAWTPPVLWNHHFGNPNLYSGATGAAADSTGLYVTGFVDRTPIVGGGLMSGTTVLAKYDDGGSQVWMVTVPNSTGVSPRISIGAGGIYLEISGSNNETILKYTTSGTKIWNETIKPPIGIQQMAATTDGIVVAGISNRTLTNQTLTGSSIMYVRDYDPDGRTVWTSEFSNSTSDSILGISANSSGIYVLTQEYLVGFSPNGRELWADSITERNGIVPFSVSSDSTGIYLSGITTANYLDLQQGFLAKYNFQGGRTWFTTFLTPDYSGVVLTDVSADGSGAYTSMSSGVGHDFIFSYDANGNQIWVDFTGLTTSQEDFLITNGPSNFYIAGAVQGLPGRQGYVQGFSRSNALVFFGINPPYSYVLIASIIAVVALSILYLRRYYARKAVLRAQLAPRVGLGKQDLSP